MVDRLLGRGREPGGRRTGRGRGRRRSAGPPSGRASSRPATCAGRGPSSSSARWPTTSSRSTATGCSATTRRSSPASPGSTAGGSSSSASRRAPTPTRTSAATSGCRTRRATARRCGRWSSPSGSGCRSSRSSTCRAPIPAPESEERGIAEAIARSIGLMSRLRTPIVTVITGEGGSGGALAIAVADVVVALENAVYSVISPEGCAAILWRTADEAATAAVAMRMTAAEQQALGVVDIVVTEPGEGAHTDHAETARRLKAVIVAQLDALARIPLDDLVEARYRRFRALGPYTEVATPPAPPVERPGLADRLRNLFDPGPLAGRAPAAMSRPPGTRSDDDRRSDRAAGRRGRTRTEEDRAADHAAIDHLADELLPALVAKLAGDRPRRDRGPRGRLEGPRPPAGRRGHGRASGEPPIDRLAAAAGPCRPRPSAGRLRGPSLRARGPRARRPLDERIRRRRRSCPVGPGGPGGRRGAARTERDQSQAVATSPAVGVYQPRPRRGPARASDPATGSAPSTCSASPRRSSPRPTASSGPASSSPARPSSTARSSS